MRNHGIGSWPARRARRSPDRVALLHRDRPVTYRELHERVLRAANGLRVLGVRGGDRVAYLGGNHPAFLETLFACGLLGAVFVPLNTRLAGPELAHVLTDSGSSVLVHAPGHAQAVAGLRTGTPVRRFVALEADRPAAGDTRYEELLAAPPEPVDLSVGHQDPCLIMYTSGTTGRPKGAVLTHGNVVWNCLNLLVDLDLGSDGVSLVHAPLFHAAALNLICLPTLLKGGKVLLEDAFDPQRALELIERERVGFVFAVPTMHEATAAAPGWATADLSSLRIVLSGGAPAADRTVRAYLDRGLPFVQGYGLTESSPCATVLEPERAADRAGSVGAANFFSDLRVAGPDPAGAADAADGEQGELLLEGPNVMAGYWGDPDATDAVLSGGWLRTGDVGVRDADGCVRVVDRLKNMIISGGENIYPAEVENVLHGHPAVAECAVFGVPDPKWGESGHAAVVLRPGASADGPELLGFLRERLAGYKVPRAVRFLPALPRNALGKLLRHRLAELP
ncbi:long-chain fatty acid--CoA ligase [Kitasatospora cineracea]|uniref:acyl-CoA synthetase n=1 Tax=Kitasatospora cineracea TaxID=88074 RepID=UPI0038082B5F